MFPVPSNIANPVIKPPDSSTLTPSNVSSFSPEATLISYSPFSSILFPNFISSTSFGFKLRSLVNDSSPILTSVASI